jgi:hypothetical protein
METAIGIFSSRECCQDAIGKLLEEQVPRHSIVFLTHSESEAEVFGKLLGATVAGFLGIATGMAAGVGAATLLAFSTRQVSEIGFGAAGLLGLAGVVAGSRIGKVVSFDANAPVPIGGANCSRDAALFGEMLKGGRSLIIVRAETQETARVAVRILEPFSPGIEGVCSEIVMGIPDDENRTWKIRPGLGAFLRRRAPLPKGMTSFLRGSAQKRTAQWRKPHDVIRQSSPPDESDVDFAEGFDDGSDIV